MPDTIPSRIETLDLLRGIALCGMAVFHLAWDLSVFGLIAVDVAASPGWIAYASTVAGSFLGLSGVSLVLAHRDGLRWQPYLQRLGRIAAAAGLVTLGSWVFDPGAFIFFGILHCIAVSGVLALPLLRAPWWLLAALAAGFWAGAEWLRSPIFNGPHGWWLGLATKLPPSADFIPVFPWFGIVLLGMLGGRALLRREGGGFWRWRAAAAPTRALAWAGRHSLIIYLLHQPILIGLLMAATTLLG